MSPTGCPSDRAAGTVDSVPDVDRPKQGELVVAVQRGYRVALLGQRLDPAPFRQELPDLASQMRHRFLGPGPSQALFRRCRSGLLRSHDARRAALPAAPWLLLVFAGYGATSSRSVRRVHACVPGAAEQASTYDACPAARCREGRSPPGTAASAANWRSLVWAMPSRSGSGSSAPSSQSSRSIPSLIVFGVAGPGACLRRLKLVVVLLGSLISKVSNGHMLGCQACRDQIKDPPMNFRAKSIHQPVERAERGKVDRSRVQCLDRSVDEVSRVVRSWSVPSQAWCC